MADAGPPSTVVERSSPYAEHAETIESVLLHTCRVHRLTADAAEEFSSWARVRLLDDDCAILRKHQGVSSLRGFLVAVVQRLLLDWRILEWGRWRPSADAVRLGPAAIELEKLVLRDHLPFEHAVETVLARGLARTRDECERLWIELPRRPYGRRASEHAVDSLAAPAAAADPIELAEDLDSAARARAALADAIPALAAQEQLLIRLRYQDGFTVARIAALLRVEQKPLYRRFGEIHARLRARLKAAGVTEAAVRRLLGNPAVELDGIFSPAEVGKAVAGPSTVPGSEGTP